VLTVTAERPGWVWIRVPWDPHWRADTGVPVSKGGPGHIVMWAKQGVTELRWDVPTEVDVAATGVTVTALVGTSSMAWMNRRRGFNLNLDRAKPAARAVTEFADTVDDWVRTAAYGIKRALCWRSRSGRQ